MVGKTFNPSSITSEQIIDRETSFVSAFKETSLEMRQAYWKNVKEMQEVWQGSWPWEWCAFQRNFIDFNQEVV